MAGMKALVGLAFTGALGLMFLMLACGLEHYGVYWPLFVLIFYITMPIPLLMAKRQSDDEGSSACRELAYFIATGITVSAFGLPLVMAHAEVIKWGACCLVMAGNVAIFSTILSFFFVFAGDSFSWES